MRKIFILNGPNLGMLGSREPEIYGSATMSELKVKAEEWVGDKAKVDIRQTDSESELIAWIHEAFQKNCDVILNPAAFTHYSYALRDAVAILQKKVRVIEVHLSNPHSREKFRHTSVISGVAAGVIAGFGFDSYRLALAALA